ncbi:hypothetical protein ACTWP6_29305 [Mycobacterium sp. 4D054]|uniref:hypothetical protein n=1 Tax=Mycobacterium sp. 4D054 TaxID=3457440 RepID=UPI003FD30056
MTGEDIDVRLPRPLYIREHHWAAVNAEADRLQRSLQSNDGSQALADIKCVVESIARIVLDVNGTPADPNASFSSIVAQANSTLKGQPGDELANQTVFGNMATQAGKIAQNLGDIRNQFGGGHGRARTPVLTDEMVRLALDGGLLWARWALRRLGYFTEGRPDSLIDDLNGSPRAIFRSGELERRLVSANLPTLSAQHQRAIGVAVGQRAASGTFVVHWDGVEPCLNSDDLAIWPRDYRLGVAYGLWFDAEGNVTFTPVSAREALAILDPVGDCSADLADWVQRIAATRQGWTLPAWDAAAFETAESIRGKNRSDLRRKATCSTSSPTWCARIRSEARAISTHRHFRSSLDVWMWCLFPSCSCAVRPRSKRGCRSRSTALWWCGVGMPKIWC